MRSLVRNLRRNWHLTTGTKKYNLDGIWLCTEKGLVPRFVSSLIFKHSYEDAERELVQHILNKNSRVLEIGCGIGMVSILARKIATDGHVRSYEANPAMEDVIRKNYALNGLSPDLIMKAITKTGDTLEFFMDENVLSSSSIDRGKAKATTTIESDCFSSVISEYAPDSIIMDVEGAEIDLLNDIELAGVSNMIVELHPHIVGGDAIDRMLKNLSANGFDVTRQIGKVCLLERQN